MDYSREIKGHTLEYFDEEHIYLVDGQILPSVTQLLSWRFGKKFDHVPAATLKRAAEKGIYVHNAIEHYCKTGEEDEDCEELRNFKFLQRQYGFKVWDNEVPVILFEDEDPIAAGRLDMVLTMGDEFGGADIKRTSALDKEYLAYQLNLYRIAFKQCYGLEWTFLRGIWLRGDTRKFVTIPINEEAAWELIHEWRREHEQSDIDRQDDE